MIQEEKKKKTCSHLSVNSCVFLLLETHKEGLATFFSTGPNSKYLLLRGPSGLLIATHHSH